MIELNKIYNSDCLTFLIGLPDNFIDCCVTSPPYYGLRDYGVDGQLGLEATPEEYVSKLVQIFSRVKRVLKPEGILWLNLGDSYNGSGKGGNPENSPFTKQKTNQGSLLDRPTRIPDLKPKDLIGIPWMVAFALRADGWYLRQDIIWHKPNPMPESVTDRCTKSHEYIFLLSKSQKYYYDYEAILEPAVWSTEERTERQTWDNKSVPTILKNGIRPKKKGPQTFGGKKAREGQNNGGDSRNGYRTDANSQWGKTWESENPTRNKRSVWTIGTMPYSEAHFATFPEKLIVPCIKAGCPEGGIVLDPFMGAGTTALVSHKLNRNYLGCDINSEYCTLAEKRIKPYLMQQKLF